MLDAYAKSSTANAGRQQQLVGSNVGLGANVGRKLQQLVGADVGVGLNVGRKLQEAEV